MNREFDDELLRGLLRLCRQRLHLAGFLVQQFNFSDEACGGFA